MKLFNSLKGTVNIEDMHNIALPSDVLAHWKEIAPAWNEANNWVEWWTRLPHLRMLCDTFRDSSSASEKAPKDTNGVERITLDSKQKSPTCLKLAMEYVYKKDKCLALSYMAAEKQFSLSYRERSEETRRSLAAKRRNQRACLIDPDHQAEFGPPDKSSNFRSWFACMRGVACVYELRLEHNIITDSFIYSDSSYFSHAVKI